MSAGITHRRCPFDRSLLELRNIHQGEPYWFCRDCGHTWAHGVLVPSRARGETDAANLRIAEDPRRDDSSIFLLDEHCGSGKIAELIAGRLPPELARDFWSVEEITHETVPAPRRPAPDAIELFYDRLAPEFDQIMNMYDLERRVDTVFDTLLGRYDLRDRTLLDAGCGTGWFSLRACQRGADVTALDIGPSLLEQVRRKCDADTICGDVLDLQFPDDHFDVVVSSECIEHTRDPHAAVRELIRVCKPGGLVAITCPNRFWYWLCVVANVMHWRPYEGIEDWPRWRDFRSWVEEENTHIIDMRGIHLFPFQVKALQPLLKWLDRFGRLHGPLCVNQAVLATKLC